MSHFEIRNVRSDFGLNTFASSEDLRISDSSLGSFLSLTPCAEPTDSFNGFDRCRFLGGFLVGKAAIVWS